MRPLGEWLPDATAMSKAAFCARHPTPVLVWRTDLLSSSGTDHAVHTMDRMVVRAEEPQSESMIEHYVACPLPVKPLVTIGCSPDCDVRVSDASVSRRHATLLHEPAGWRIRDADSLAGTYVNDGAAVNVTLASGDRITLGTLDLMFLQPPELYDLIARLELF